MKKVYNNNPWLHIALYRPQIPQNTGNIGRTCVGLNLPLHIIDRPSFSLDAKSVKRAGLDYWSSLKLIEHESWESFEAKLNPKRLFFFTKAGSKSLYETSFQKGDVLIFGRETSGLPKEILEKYEKNQSIFLPMPGEIRSYNLSNTVAIAAFEAYRQIML